MGESLFVPIHPLKKDTNTWPNYSSGNPKATTPEVSKEAFDANLKRMEAELAKSDARRRAARAAEDDDE